MTRHLIAALFRTARQHGRDQAYTHCARLADQWHATCQVPVRDGVFGDGYTSTPFSKIIKKERISG